MTDQHSYPHIEEVLEEKTEEKKVVHKRDTPAVITPLDTLHILRVQERETDLPNAPTEKEEIPLIPDMKKAEEDYNSVDYQIIAFNLWKSKAREPI